MINEAHFRTLARLALVHGGPVSGGKRLLKALDKEIWFAHSTTSDNPKPVFRLWMADGWDAKFGFDASSVTTMMSAVDYLGMTQTKEFKMAIINMPRSPFFKDEAADLAAQRGNHNIAHLDRDAAAYYLLRYAPLDNNAPVFFMGDESRFENDCVIAKMTLG